MDTDALLWAGAHAQAQALQRRELSAPELLRAVLERLAEAQQAYNPFRVVCEAEAVHAAEQAQQRLDAGEQAALLGVPVAIKDDTDVAGHSTCRGTDPSVYPPAAADSELVTRLRRAGAVIVGKTHVPELTTWPFTETVHHGATRNPWAPQRTPGGSSGGSAAAVAAGVVGVAHGSDGAGSIRIPAGWCGLVGLKPTRDLVPTAPATNTWHRLLHFGPLARDVASAARFMDACAQPGSTSGADSTGSYLAALEQPLRPLRIALSRHSPPGTLPALHREQRAALQRAADLLTEAGHQVRELDPRVPLSATGYVLARYLRGVHDSAREVPPGLRLEPRGRGMRRIGAVVPAAVVRASLRAEPALASRVLAVFDEVDVVLQPGPSSLPPLVGAYARAGAARTLGSSIMKVPFLPLWNLIGNPVLAVPVQLSQNGLPTGVQLIAPPGCEHLLLRLALQLEQATGWTQHRPPPP